MYLMVTPLNYQKKMPEWLPTQGSVNGIMIERNKNGSSAMDLQRWIIT